MWFTLSLTSAVSSRLCFKFCIELNVHFILQSFVITVIQMEIQAKGVKLKDKKSRVAVLVPGHAPAGTRLDEGVWLGGSG